MLSRSVPKARAVPASGDVNPLNTLKNVVLPAPFGPINPQVPVGNSTLTSSSGVTPPKRTVRRSISIIGPAQRVGRPHATDWPDPWAPGPPGPLGRSTWPAVLPGRTGSATDRPAAPSSSGAPGIA